MSPRYSSLACQCVELFSKLLANAENTLVASFASSPTSCSFKVSHLSDASWPPKNRMWVTLSSLGVCAMVKYWVSLWVKNVQAASLSSACQSIRGSISGGRVGIPGTAMAPSSSSSEIFVYFTLGGSCGPEMKMLLEGRLMAQMTGRLIHSWEGLY